MRKLQQEAGELDLPPPVVCKLLGAKDPLPALLKSLPEDALAKLPAEWTDWGMECEKVPDAQSLEALKELLGRVKIARKRQNFQLLKRIETRTVEEWADDWTVRKKKETSKGKAGPVAFKTARKTVARPGGGFGQPEPPPVGLGADEQLDNYLEGGPKRKRQEGGVGRVGGSRDGLKQSGEKRSRDEVFGLGAEREREEPGGKGKEKGGHLESGEPPCGPEETVFERHFESVLRYFRSEERPECERGSTESTHREDETALSQHSLPEKRLEDLDKKRMVTGTGESRNGVGKGVGGCSQAIEQESAKEALPGTNGMLTEKTEMEVVKERKRKKCDKGKGENASSEQAPRSSHAKKLKNGFEVPSLTFRDRTLHAVASASVHISPAKPRRGADPLVTAVVPEKGLLEAAGGAEDRRPAMRKQGPRVFEQIGKRLLMKDLPEVTAEDATVREREPIPVTNDVDENEDIFRFKYIKEIR
jgi:hypothetical protein